MELKIPSNIQFLVAVVVIYVAYGRSAFVQERMMSHTYVNEDGTTEKFVYTVYLLFFQTFCAVLTSKLVIFLLRLPGNAAPITSYFLVSATFILAQFFSVHSLLYVSYPAAVLAKSCKPIPVMLIGIFVLRKHYAFSKYVYVGMMCLGIVFFSYNPNKGTDHATTMWGYILLAASLGLDGVTGNFQEKLVKLYSPSSNHLMYYSNLWASFLLFIALLFTGEFADAMSFSQRHPQVFDDLLWFGLCNAIGQHAVYFLVRNFGALVLSTVTTTRKFFSILWSVVWFGHPVTNLQWTGVFLVFASLILDVYKKTPPKAEPLSPASPEVTHKEDVEARSR